MTETTSAPGRRARLRTVAITLFFVAGLAWLASTFLGYTVTKVSEPIPMGSLREPQQPTLSPGGERPRNVILVVADGLGFDHLSLAELIGDGSAAWNDFAVRGWHDPRPVLGTITDSAASATAMATGAPTLNDRVGVDQEGRPLKTVFESAWDRDWRTGIVTDSYIWDGTPAAFVAHTEDRDNAASILDQLGDSQLDILLGELEDVGEGDVPTWEETVAILQRRFTLIGADLQIDSGLPLSTPIASIHPEEAITNASSVPNLGDMTTVAVRRLADSGERFLLLVETEELDSGSHRRDAERVVTGLRTLESVVRQLLEFSRNRGDTLLVFTSDHETGGLSLGYELDSYPDIVLQWGSEDHTSGVVPLFADGPGADAFAGVQRVWHVGALLHELLRSSP